MFTFTPYRSTHTHKTFRRCSWSRRWSKGTGQDENTSLPKHLHESSRPNRFLVINSGHFRCVGSHHTDGLKCVFFLHVHRETSSLANELPEKSDHFRFLHAACLPNLKGSVALIMTKTSPMRISIPSTFHLGLSCHYRVSSVLVSPHLF